MSQSTITRPEKPLSQQVSERLRRAEDERPFYTIRWVGMNVTVGGVTRRELVAGITKRAEYVRRGEEQTSYFVTRCGCNCPDANKAREAGIVRPCKHTFITELDLAERSSFPDEGLNEPEDLAALALSPEQEALVSRLVHTCAETGSLPVEAPADEETERRAAVRSRMEQDFPDFDPVLS